MRRLACLAVLLLATAVRAAGGVDGGGEALLLVAGPQMRDPNFARSVVLVTFPQQTGPMGVILNRPLGAGLGEVLTDRPALRRHTDPLFFGGPVEPDGILFLFRTATPPGPAVPVLDDIYFSGDGELFAQVVAGADAAARRFFVGYAGWAPGQLDAEIARGDWYVLEVDAELIFDVAGTGDLWQRMLQRARAVTADLATAAGAASGR